MEKFKFFQFFRLQKEIAAKQINRNAANLSCHKWTEFRQSINSFASIFCYVQTTIHDDDRKDH